MKLSVVIGFGGYIFFDAKNFELVEHYSLNSATYYDIHG